MATMDSFTLGQAPHRMTLVLPNGADFVAAITRNDGADWATGEGNGVYLEIGEVTWWASAIGPTVSWDVDEAEVAAVIATNPDKARLFYVEGETRLLWAAGPVIVK